jgi:hypothetical protein
VEFAEKFLAKCIGAQLFAQIPPGKEAFELWVLPKC